MASDSTGWPLLDDRAPVARRAARTRRQHRPRPAWLLAVLAFVCGGLVSAAGFSVGWRHQAQRGSAAEASLVQATAHVHALQASLATAHSDEAAARRAEKRAHSAAAAAEASARSLAAAAATVGRDAAASRNDAGTISGEASGLTSSTAKLASELQTLETYLTTTPPRQLDAGYIASQTSYLTHRLSQLQTAGGTLGSAVATFEAAAQKLSRQASALSGGG